MVPVLNAMSDSIFINKPTNELKWPDDFVGHVICGGCLEIMRMMPDQSVQCCVTSPPYWGLRDYGVAGQLGLETTLEEYIAKILEIGKEIHRVLKDDGTLWLNLGDRYADDSKWGGQSGGKQAYLPYADRSQCGRSKIISGIPRKNLIGIPWLVAFGLQSAGWYLRSEIIWYKIQCLPESVQDRPSVVHEKIFLLAKSEDYYYDGDAIREPYAPSSLTRKELPNTDTGARLQQHQPGTRDRSAEARICPPNPLGRGSHTVWEISPGSYRGGHFATFPPKIPERCLLAGSRPGDIILDPFFGIGTTGKRAKELERLYIGIDISPEYCRLAKDELSQTELFSPEKPRL